MLISLTLLIGPKNNVVLETKLQFQHIHFNFTKLQVLRTTLIFWQVIRFFKIELEHKCDLESQLDNSIPLLDSILTPISLPDFSHFSESVLDPVPVHREIKSPTFQDLHIKLDQYHTFKSPIDKLASFIFMKSNSKRNVTLIHNFVTKFKFLNQYWLLFCYPIWVIL